MSTAHSRTAITELGQLTLFERPQVPDRFRIDDATRRRGLRHIAEIRARLEARYPTPTPPHDPDRRDTPESRVSRRAA